jgi:hypothetical protein
MARHPRRGRLPRDLTAPVYGSVWKLLLAENAREQRKKAETVKQNIQLEERKK